MKKVLFVLLLAITFVACEGPMGPTGKTGPEGPQGPGTSWDVVKIPIKKTDWILVGNPGELKSYYYAQKTVPQLTKSIFEDGNVNGYIEFLYDDNKTRKYSLPYSFHNAAVDGTNTTLWTELHSFKFEPGKVTFYVSYSDFATDLGGPENETYYLVLTY